MATFCSFYYFCELLIALESALISTKMSYHLSAAKLKAYRRCPQAYYFQYERGLGAARYYNTTALGLALHQALAQFYGNWHYQTTHPDREWMDHCWANQSVDLSSTQAAEGQVLLQRYFDRFVLSQPAMRRPLGIEGRIQGYFQFEGLEFTLSGRYDRLDLSDHGLDLIDYKSARTVKLLDPNQVDLQLGLYYLALEQRYGRVLRSLNLIYLRTGEVQRIAATPEHRQQAIATIGRLAQRLRTDATWDPQPGDHCSSCTYAQYCPALHPSPEPLPQEAQKLGSLQLSLDL